MYVGLWEGVAKNLLNASGGIDPAAPPVGCGARPPHSLASRHGTTVRGGRVRRGGRRRGRDARDRKHAARAAATARPNKSSNP
jgi:hypothetical protein